MTGSGTISWTEFLASTIETLGPVSEEEFSSAFDHLDLDSSGYISTGVRFEMNFASSSLLMSTH
jgi:Ca2+-binding EF-hand superfamily protein